MRREQIDFIKKSYPAGTRIRLFSMEDPFTPLPCGAKGTVAFVDDMGTIHMKWDNGRTLGLIPGVDSFETIIGTDGEST